MVIMANYRKLHCKNGMIMRSTLDWNQCRYFVAVVSEGSFAGAARALSVPTSTVSRYVQRLEEQLGTRLLERHTRHLRLTESGKFLYERARPMMDDMLQLENALRHNQQELKGVLKLCLPSEFIPAVLGPVIAEFAVAHPGVEIDCITSLTGWDPIRDDVDLSILFQRGKPDDSTLVVQTLLSLPSCVVASPSLLMRHPKPQTVQELQALPCISTRSALKGAPWHFLGERGQSIRLPVRSSYRVDSGELARTAALAGAGFALLAEAACQTELASGTLVRIDLDLQAAPLDIVAVYPSRHHVPAKVRVLLEWIRERLRNGRP